MIPLEDFTDEDADGDDDDDEDEDVSTATTSKVICRVEAPIGCNQVT